MTSQPNRKGGRHLAKKEPNYRRRMILMIVLAVVMVLAAVICVLVSKWVQRPELPPTVENPTHAPVQTLPPASSHDPEVSPTPSLPEYDPVQPKVSGERKSKDFYTILVFGTDESSNLTDTMMVVSYDVTNQKAAVMSLPRDTIINSRAYGVDAKKLNAVYTRGGGGEKGITNLKNEVSELVGFMPDYYVQIDWAIVGQMVDAIGGVWFEVPRDMWYADPYQDIPLYIDLKAGYQKLNGDQAMQLVRWRKNMDPVTFKVTFTASDITRLELQHSFLKAVLKQVLQLKNVTRISELAKVFGENVVSDLTIENLFWFGSQAIMGGLSVDSVEFSTMPYGYGSFPVKQSNGKYSERSFVYPLQKKLLEEINGKLNPFVNDVTLKELDLIYVKNDGGLASTSGSLADPSMAELPVTETPKPSPSPEPSGSPDPENSRNPIVDQAPGGSGSSDPQPSPSAGPGTDPTPAPTPAPTPTPDPEPSADPDPEPTPSDGGGLEFPDPGGIWDNPL